MHCCLYKHQCCKASTYALQHKQRKQRHLHSPQRPRKKEHGGKDARQKQIVGIPPEIAAELIDVASCGHRLGNAGHLLHIPVCVDIVAIHQHYLHDGDDARNRQQASTPYLTAFATLKADEGYEPHHCRTCQHHRYMEAAFERDAPLPIGSVGEMAESHDDDDGRHQHQP